MPIALLARTPLFLAVHAGLPMKTLQEFVDYARAHPGELNYGSAGVGSIHHLSMEAMKAALHLDMTHVPYRGTGQAVPALLGDHVQVLWASYPISRPASKEARSGCSPTTARPFAAAADLPPLADIIPGFEWSA